MDGGIVMTTDRPIFILHLRPEPNVDPIRALRLLLKAASRRYGLRCINAVAHIESTEGSS
jgi:hypothetical protein